LDMERQAIQCMMHHVTHFLEASDKLPTIKSEQAQALQSRAYTTDQANLIAQNQNEKNSLATQLSLSSGLRAHELLTLQPREIRAPDQRPALTSKWTGRDGVIYTVEGKGGLVREVLIPSHLAERL
ncbi:site-specific integrase, partial [Vibrio parahaemolyticus]|nr:site-specific integrase [Vibrio parahaemolyticus]